MTNSSTHGLSHNQDLSQLEENISKAENRVTELYALSNTYFGNDKQDRMMKITSEICNELLPVVPLSSNSSEDIDASLPPNLRFSRLPAKIRAQVCFLRGRALDALPQYSAEAEECLSKAINFNPQFVDAWNALARCFWKKNDLLSAKSCYTQALSQEKNKISLRELSRVLRLIEKPGDVEKNMIAKWKEASSREGDRDTIEPPSNSEIQSAVSTSQDRLKQNVSKSVEYAREAISMDFKDGESWYALGNAYLSHFMINTGDMEDMTKALQAFNQAERSPDTAQNPDLHYNRATIHKYLENYQLAFDGFSKAFQLDRNLDAAEKEMHAIKQTVTKVHQLTSKKSTWSRNKKLQDALSQYVLEDRHCLKKPLTPIVLGELTRQRDAANRVLHLRVLTLASSATSTPLIFIATDKDGALCALSVYFVRSDAIKDNVVVSIVDPTLDDVKFSSRSGNTTNSPTDEGEKQSQYLKIAVKNPTSMFINNRPIVSESFNSPEMSVQVWNG